MKVVVNARVGLGMISALALLVGSALAPGCKDSNKESSGSGSTQPSTSNTQVRWPSGSGYLAEPTHRPSSPHKVKPSKVEAKITDVETRNGKTIALMEGSFEVRDGQMISVFPGSVITNVCQSPSKVDAADYNGDKCVLPYGITVVVDDYGQFVPVKYDPSVQGPSATAPVKGNRGS